MQSIVFATINNLTKFLLNLLHLVQSHDKPVLVLILALPLHSSCEAPHSVACASAPACSPLPSPALSQPPQTTHNNQI